MSVETAPRVVEHVQSSGHIGECPSQIWQTLNFDQFLPISGQGWSTSVHYAFRNWADFCRFSVIVGRTRGSKSDQSMKFRTIWSTSAHQSKSAMIWPISGQSGRIWSMLPTNLGDLGTNSAEVSWFWPYFSQIRTGPKYRPDSARVRPNHRSNCGVSSWVVFGHKAYKFSQCSLA